MLGERELVGSQIGLDLIGFGLKLCFEFGQALVEDFDAFVGVADILPFAGRCGRLASWKWWRGEMFALLIILRLNIRGNQRSSHRESCGKRFFGGL